MGSTPSIDLQDAAIRGKLKDIKTLTDPIENGGQNMDINEQDEELGYSALTEAIKCMHIVGSKKKMIKMYEFILDERKADIGLLTSADETPLHIACYLGRIEMVRMLIERGIKVDEPDKAGYKPIHWACLNGHLDCVDELLKHNVDLTLRVGGMTPYDMCRLRLNRKEHGNGMFSFTPDPWSKVERERSVFFKICEKIEILEEEQREAKREEVRAKRRLRMPGDPLFDKKMRKKVYCINKDCRQGYRSVSKVRGICPECREKERKRLEKEAWANREQIRADKIAAMKELKRLRRLEKIEKWWEQMDPSITCNEQAMLLWDTCLRMLLDEAKEHYSNPTTDGGEVDKSYERWYTAQLYLDKVGYEKRLNGIYELVPKDDEEEEDMAKLKKRTKNGNIDDDDDGLANVKVEEKHEEHVLTRHKQRGKLNIGKIH